MKIDQKVRGAYADHLALNRLVQEDVRIIANHRDPALHFIDRLKTEESFAQKVEAGRYSGEMVIDDFYASTFVVPNASDIGRTVAWISGRFDIVSRRPRNETDTRQRPTDFSFNDLRLYVNLKNLDYVPLTAKGKVVFEIQVKTFLQHAWGIATHDFSYKTDTLSWARSRIAHQLRAVLEHAELSIDEVDKLALSGIVRKDYEPFARINEIVALLREYWQPHQLPQDLRRLAETIEHALRTIGLSVEALTIILASEASAGRGPKQEDLSPYAATIQSLIRSGSVFKLPKRAPPLDKRVIVPPAVELPEGRSLDERFFLRL